MSDELKEILDRLKLLCYDDYCLEFSVDYIERKEEKLLLDYITYLQEENRQTRLLKDKYQLEKEIYKVRNKTAVEYLKLFDDNYTWIVHPIIKGALNLLNGGKDE